MLKVTSVEEGEAWFHETGEDNERDTMFWLYVPAPDGLYELAADFAYSDPLEGEPERVSSRFDLSIADQIEETVWHTDPIGWLCENDHLFELDSGYWQTGGLERVLIRLIDDEQASAATMFKLRFGGQS